MHILSKSTFIRGNQCLKSLYLNQYHKDFKNPVSLAQEAIFEQGENVGLFARKLFPNGIVIGVKDYLNIDFSIEESQNEIKNGRTTLYEAPFAFDGILAVLDILDCDEEGWKGYEVKSSTELKEIHIWDAALQYYVIKNSGINLKDIFIVHINNQYQRKDVLEIDQLYIKKTVLKEVLQLQSLIPEKVEKFKAVLKQKEIPNIDIGPYCHKPYPCDFISYCWKKIPSNSIFEIANLNATKKFSLYNKGIVEFKDIPRNTSLTESQWQQINCELEKGTIVNKSKIREYINRVSYPLLFLDFETFQLPIPKLLNSKPFQQIPFQYSLHRLNSKVSDLIHYEFIADINENDPRISFVEKLINDCGEGGDILVYNMAFEKTILLELARDFSEYSYSISKIIKRLVDLMIPFKKRWYYVPMMKGSYSIKVVLPSLLPELSYRDLEIKDGATASFIYSSMIDGTFSGNLEKGIKSLLEYCKLDTLAMVNIFEKLNSV